MRSDIGFFVEKPGDEGANLLSTWVHGGQALLF